MSVAHAWSGGLGLGLYIVAQLALQQGGDVLATSGGEGCGATFTVFLPVVRDG